MIDHDHFTGLVRGLLRRYCSTNIDGCLHVSGCAWADYLNNPPAAGWVASLSGYAVHHQYWESTQVNATTETLSARRHRHRDNEHPEY